MSESFLQYLSEYIFEGVESFFLGSSSKLYWLYCLTFILIGTGVLAVQHRNKKLEFSLSRIFQALFPKNHYLSKSFRLDLWIVILNLFFIFPLLYAVLIYYGIERSDFIAFLRSHFRFLRSIDLEESLSLSKFQVNFAFTLGLFVIHDFFAYVGHYIQHRFPIFWELHKVHHTAETLNPLTTYRMHPLSMMFQKALIFGPTVFFIALFKTIVSPQPTSLTILEISLFVFLYNILVLFRHSHVWLSYGPLNYIFVSPAMHQLHHSEDPKHYGKNLGNILAIWDWMFKTGYFPKKEEKFRCGIGESLEPYQSVRTAYFDPVVQIASRLKVKVFRSR